MDATFSYSFPALRGIQASDEFYVVMCPLKLVPKIFLFDEEEIPPEFRAQRTLNRSRIPEISSYILDNPKDYVFSSLTASVDGQMQFQPYTDDPNFQNLGRLFISLEARFLINDGQHRRAAIEDSLKISPELGNENISVVFFKDEGLRKSQQIFSDLNRHAVNTTSSLGILYEHRDDLANITKEIIQNIKLLERYTDKEKQSLSKLSPKIFVLSNIYNTNSRILEKRKGDRVSESEKSFLLEFWNELCNSMVEWNLVFNKQLSPSEFRVNYINAHGVLLEALGQVGNYLMLNHPNDWMVYLRKVSEIDWSRSNTEWLGRSFGHMGRINKNAEAIRLTSNLIKFKIGLPLNQQEQLLEDKLKDGETA
ncbi:DNA sulfur modification protein DndB [Paenibacillus odorifer]|uniref:DNA sulfur modification protein DndB n=1 Tax=Paenibacillus odorifer TaxID=189426 RepID=UPI00096ED1EC|nr:DNA sulfur modification protein DndB [Paenibacillus odorifer]OME27737.1 DNA sulfur modification protein DndB [Paenibacillus odorifer]